MRLFFFVLPLRGSKAMSCVHVYTSFAIHIILMFILAKDDKKKTIALLKPTAINTLFLMKITPHHRHPTTSELPTRQNIEKYR